MPFNTCVQAEHPKDVLPGREANSFGLYSNDATVLCQVSSLVFSLSFICLYLLFSVPFRAIPCVLQPARRQKAPALGADDERAKMFGAGDIVGCGVVFATRTLFWSVGHLSSALHRCFPRAFAASAVPETVKTMSFLVLSLPLSASTGENDDFPRCFFTGPSTASCTRPSTAFRR